MLLGVLLGGGIFAWVSTLRQLEFEPRAVLAAQQLASLVNLSRAALRYSDGIKDTSLNPLSGVGVGNGNFITGEVYTVDKSIVADMATSKNGA